MNSEFIFFRPKSKGHGAVNRQELLIKYLIKKKESINILTLEKDKFPLNLSARVINIKFSNFAKKNGFFRWILLLVSTIFIVENTKSRSFKLIAFSDYESIIFKIASLIIKFKETYLKDLFQKSDLTKSSKFHIIFFSRGDIVEIFKTNHPNNSFIKKIIINVMIFYYNKIQHLAISCSSTYLVQMNFLKEKIKRRHNPKKNIFVLKNNIIESTNNKNKKFEKNGIVFNKKITSKNYITIGFAAPLRIRVKSLDIFINIIKELHKKFPIKVITAGTGEDELFFTSNLKEILGCNNYKHLGWLNSLKKFYQNIDLLIVPSRYDSCPNFLLESINVDNIKIIASDIPSHREILNEDKLLFPLEDIKITLKKIDNLLKIPDEEYISYREEIKSNFKFNWENEACKIIYRDL